VDDAIRARPTSLKCRPRAAIMSSSAVRTPSVRPSVRPSARTASVARSRASPCRDRLPHTWLAPAARRCPR
jgi:hypothetical protein